MFLGVCGGIGDYLGMDPTLVRVVFAVVTVFTAFVPGIVTYFLLGLILPSDVSVSV
jgi:phage shock protein PspC (stress-responsive transcriptional regulator)